MKISTRLSSRLGEARLEVHDLGSKHSHRLIFPSFSCRSSKESTGHREQERISAPTERGWVLGLAGH